MPKDKIDLTREYKPVEMKSARDAEDALQRKDFVRDRIGDARTGLFENVKELREIRRDPMFNKELLRRQKEGEVGAFEADLLTGKYDRVRINAQNLEKRWVFGKMEELRLAKERPEETEEERLERERLEEERLNREREERDQRNLEDLDRMILEMEQAAQEMERVRLEEEEQARQNLERARQEGMRRNEEEERERLEEEERQRLEKEEEERKRLEEEERLRREKEEEEQAQKERERLEQERRRIEEEEERERREKEQKELERQDRELEEEKHRQEEEKEKKREEKKRLREAGRGEEYRLRVNYYAGALLSKKLKVVVYLPRTSSLLDGFSSKFSSISERKRREKQKNPKSELYRKLKNAALLEEGIKKTEGKVYSRAAKLYDQFPSNIGIEDSRDLAWFMSGDKRKDEELCKMFFASKDKQGKAMVNKNDASMALVKMAEMLVSTNMKDLRMDDDTQVAAHAPELETLTARLAAFDRMSSKYDFVSKLPEEVVEKFHAKMGFLREVCAYYSLRKNIITNQYYRNHYNREMSLDLSKAKNKDQKELTDLMVSSIVVARNLMGALNGNSQDKEKLNAFRFTNEATQKNYLDKQEKYGENKQEAYARLIAEGYSGKKWGIEADNVSAIDMRAYRVIEEARRSEAMRAEEPLDRSILVPEELQENAEKEKAGEKQEALSQISVERMGNLISADEITPLQGTPELAAVRRSIGSIRALITNQMPPIKTDANGQVDKESEKAARAEIDQTCVLITMMYSRLHNAIAEFTKVYGGAYRDLSDMLQELSEEARQESKDFKDKTLQYREMACGDVELRQKKLRWENALRFNRSIFYDLDHDKEKIGVMKQGEGASVVYALTTEVQKAGQKEEKTVYFREKDYVPSANNHELMESVMKKYKLSEETEKSLNKVMSDILSSKAAIDAYLEQIKESKLKDDDEILTDVEGFINSVSAYALNYEEEESIALAKFFVDFHDTLAKRNVASELNISARIDNGRNLSDRNVATSRLAAMLGIQDMIADSRTATIRQNGKLIEGNLMENTQGVPTLDTSATYSTNAATQLFMLQIFDFICGQVDRHFKNFHGIVENGEIKSIKGIDNDMAFGKLNPDTICAHNHGSYNRIRPITKDTLRALPVAFTNRILSLNRDYLEQVLGDILNREEFDSLEKRLNHVKNEIAKMASSSEDAVLDEKKGLSYTGEMADDELRMLESLDSFYLIFERNGSEMAYHTDFCSEKVKKMHLNSKIEERRRELENKE